MNADHEDRIRRLERLMDRLENGQWLKPWLALAPGPLQGVYFPAHAWSIEGQREDGLPDIPDMPRIVRDMGAYPRLTFLPDGDATDNESGRILFKDQLYLSGTPSTGAEFFVFAADQTTPLAIYGGRCDLKLRGLSLTLGTDFTLDDSGHIITTTIAGADSGEPGVADFTHFYLAWAFVRA